MKEIQDIVQAYARHQEEGKKTALATVVHVEGSSYRRPGARMLVSEDGQLTGAISGGCLEGDALRKARLAMSQLQPALVKYDTMDDDDSKLGVGLGCNGIIHILIEPITPENPNNPMAMLQAVLQQRQKAVIVTLFSLENRRAAQPGTCLLLQEDGLSYSNLGDSALEEKIVADASDALSSENSSMKAYEGDLALTGFVELLQPAVSLVICGAGNDVMPLVNMAALLGWPVTIVDGRANYAALERFPAAKHVLVAKPEQVLSQVTTDARTVFLLMTHNYNYDIAMLRQLLPMQLPYVGVLGPKTKLERLLDELREEGQEITEEQLQKVFGPIGLDLGAESAEEIALSVLAEIKAVLSHRPGNSLRQKKAPIHAGNSFAIAS